MKATELRIGNYVDLIGKGVTTVNGMLIHNQETQKDRGVEDVSLIEPIPLTEEWLIKFGFEKCNEKHSYKIVYQHKSKHKVFYHINRMRIKVVASNTWVKYVHQLQNLYFALTGIELTCDFKKI